MRWLRSSRLAACVWSVMVSLMPAFGLAGDSVGDAEVCAVAAAAAARETGVPEAWLQAIALAESGRGQGGRRVAWPWAVNDHGQAHWFSGKHRAVRHVERRLAMGRSSVDIGCFQINWRWHGAGFDTVGDAFEPLANARYAARFLRQLHRQTGSWPQAVGRYHSATPHLGKAYQARVVRIRETAADLVPPVRMRRLPRAAGGVSVALIPPARPLLRAASQPLIRDLAPARREAGSD